MDQRIINPIINVKMSQNCQSTFEKKVAIFWKVCLKPKFDKVYPRNMNIIVWVWGGISEEIDKSVYQSFLQK